MLKRKLPKNLLTLAIAGIMSMQLMADETGTITLEERKLPVSQKASESIQEFQRTAPYAVPSVLKEMSIPQTPDEWKNVVEEFNASRHKAALELAEMLNVHYEEDVINGVDVYRVTPEVVAPKYKNNVFFHIHGGAWLYGGDESILTEAAALAHNLQMPVISVNYRKAPDHPAPAAVNDIIAVWAQLITERPADAMMIGGSSAGGNLTTASAMRMRDLGMPMPAALFIGTPAATVLKATDSRFIMEGIDHNLGTWDNFLEATAAQYYGDHDPRDPYISPIYGSFEDLPASFLVSGTRDMMLSDTVLLHRSLRGAGVSADLHVYEGHSHGGYGVPGDDNEDFFRELNAFIDDNIKSYRRIARRHLSSPIDVDSLMIPENTNN